MKNKKKPIIDTYKTIYSIDIVITKNATLEQLNKLYSYNDGDDLESSIIDCVASVSCCRRRSDNVPVILVVWNKNVPNFKVDDKKGYMINTMAHEATHVAIDCWDYISENIDVGHQESFAYFVGWVAECIYRTITK